MAQEAPQTNSDYRHAYIQRQLSANPTVADHSQVQGGVGDSTQHANPSSEAPKAADYKPGGGTVPKPKALSGIKSQGGKEAAGSDAGTINPPNVGQPPTITAAGSSEDQPT